MNKPFNADEAKDHLLEREKLEKEAREKDRIAMLRCAISCLKKMFLNSNVNVYLVGSLIKPYKFTKQSDIDIVLKNFSGNRFDICTQLEAKLNRSVEIILYEQCHFKNYINKEGLKVI